MPRKIFMLFIFAAAIICTNINICYANDAKYIPVYSAPLCLCDFKLFLFFEKNNPAQEKKYKILQHGNLIEPKKYLEHCLDLCELKNSKFPEYYINEPMIDAIKLIQELLNCLLQLKNYRWELTNEMDVMYEIRKETPSAALTSNINTLRKKEECLSNKVCDLIKSLCKMQAPEMQTPEMKELVDKLVDILYNLKKCNNLLSLEKSKEITDILKDLANADKDIIVLINKYSSISVEDLYYKKYNTENKKDTAIQDQNNDLNTHSNPKQYDNLNLDDFSDRGLSDISQIDDAQNKNIAMNVVDTKSVFDEISAAGK